MFVLGAAGTGACSRSGLDLDFAGEGAGIPGPGTGFDASADAEHGGDGSGGRDADGSGTTDTTPRDAPGGDAAGPGAAVVSTYLVDPAHTGTVAPVTLTAPLSRAWSVNLGGAVSHPLVAGGTVYVATNGPSSGPNTFAHVIALGAATGSTLWTANLAGATFATIAYEGGRVFAVDGENFTSGITVHAYDATTGAEVWAAPVINQSFFDAPPVAYRGILYVYGDGEGGTVYAFDEASGTLLWQQLTNDGGEGAPAVSDDGVFIAEACQQVYAFDRVSGAPLWRHQGPCSGGGGDTPLLDGHTLYVRDSVTGNIVLDTTTGSPEAVAFASDVPPALDGGRLFTVTGGALTASAPAKGGASWTFTGDGRLASSPLVANGTVYVGSSEGNLYAVREDSGALVWSENTGVPLQTREQFVDPPRVAFAAGGGLLFVPVGASLFAYAPAPSPPGDGGAGPPDAAGDAGCTWGATPVTPPATTGELPGGLGIGDLNRDGHLDLAISDTYDSTLGVHLGHGDGTFAAETTYKTPISGGGGAVAIADIDGDGHLDVVGVNSYSNPTSVSVFPGAGDGTLKPRIDTTTDSEPRGLGVADFDGDGRLDVAVVAGDGVDVLLGKGDGTFQPPVAYALSAGAMGIALGDLNGDGATDLAVTDENGGDVAVLVGHGDGTFAAPVAYAVGTLPGSVAAGDVNGDGHVDLAVVNYRDDTVSVLLGVGDGTFHPQVPFSVGVQPAGVAVGDVNRDGHADLAVTNIGASTVSILLGNGDGTFQPQFVYGTQSGPGDVAIADLNSDGWPDLAIVDSDSNAVTVLLGGCR
jgi:outer membrane protein assembly factor BamB